MFRLGSLSLTRPVRAAAIVLRSASAPPETFSIRGQGAPFDVVFIPYDHFSAPSGELNVVCIDDSGGETLVAYCEYDCGGDADNCPDLVTCRDEDDGVRVDWVTSASCSEFIVVDVASGAVVAREAGNVSSSSISCATLPDTSGELAVVCASPDEWRELGRCDYTCPEPPPCRSAGAL